MSQPGALLGVEHRVDLLERAEERGAEALVAFHPSVAGGGGFGAVELLAYKSIGEVGECAPVVDRHLSALGFQLIENARQENDLLLVELKLVSEKAKGPADAEARTETLFAGRRRHETSPGPGAGL